MTDAPPAAGMPAADAYPPWRASAAGWPAWAERRTLERERLEARAQATDASAQLARCFPRWTGALEQLTAHVLERLARNEPVDPNDPTPGAAATPAPRPCCTATGEGT